MLFRSIKLVFDKVINTGSGYLCGVTILPGETDCASVVLSAGSTVDIQVFHETMGHTMEETLRLTAKARGYKLSGTLQPCEACHVSNARKKNVPKLTDSVATAPGEQLMLDISSV